MWNRLCRGGLAVAFIAIWSGVSGAKAAVLYGGQEDPSGSPVPMADNPDPGSRPGTAALAADAARLGAVRTFGGLNLGQSLALEAAQSRPLGDAGNPGKQALSLVGKAKVPVSDVLSITGKMGLQYQQSSLFAGGQGATEPTNPSPVYGVGLSYQAASGIELRAESERIAPRPGDPKVLTGDSFLLGARVRF